VQDDYAVQRLRDGWRFLLQSRAGRVVLRDLLIRCKFGMSAFAADSDTTMHITGRQAIGEEVMAFVNEVAPEAYYLMLKESKEDNDYDRTRTDTSDTSRSTSAGASNPWASNTGSG
jgi:hypothetical protein